MRKLHLIAHLSLDGFVAGPKGELDQFPKGEENLQFVCKLTQNADAALFGRVSYDLLEAYWPHAMNLVKASPAEIAFSAWYNWATKIVVSRSVTGTIGKNTEIIGRDLSYELMRIKNQTGKDILLFGSPTVSQTIIQLGLIDSYWIFINAILFGEGLHLFSGISGRLRLIKEDTQQFANGEVVLHYLPELD